jgi:hypothetical protein
MQKRVSLAARILLFLYIALISYQVRYHVATTGLDPSWAAGLNYFHNHGFIFGRDIEFTYGPLAYLILPMAMGSNLAQGIAFQVFCWAAFVAFFAWYIFVRKAPLINIAVGAVCLFTGSRLFYEFGYAGPDFFLSVLTLFLIAATAVARRWYLFWGAAIVATVVLMFIKLSTGIAALSAVLLFPIAMLLFDRHKARLLMLTAVSGVPLLFCVGYMVYHPAFDALWRYVRAALEISAGYSGAVGLPGGVTELATGLAVLFCFVLLSLALFFTRQISFCISTACFGPLFLEFKHSFVRQAGHIEIFFTFVPLAMLAVLLFTKFSLRSPWVPIATLTLASVWSIREAGAYQWMQAPIAPLAKGREIARLLDPGTLRRSLEQASEQNLQPDRLPGELLERVSNHSITILPWECAYAAANPIHYVPPPIIQTYSAYTPYLDDWIRSFFDAPSAPDFVLFEWEAIDERHPLLDIPAAFVALYRNYEFDSQYGGRMLLRKRAKPLSARSRLLQTTEMRLGQPLLIPPSAHPLLARVFLNLNFSGRLADFFFRVPEIRAILSPDDSRFMIARVPPKVLPDGIPLNFLPVDPLDLRSLFQDSKVNERMTSLVIGGAGAGSFSDPLRVDIYELPEVPLSFRTVAMPELTSVTTSGTIDDCKIESLNEIGVIGIAPLEVTEVRDTPGYLSVRGWATAASAVLLQVDGKLYPANYPSARPDIAALFHTSRALQSGFDWAIPAWKLGGSVHELSVKVTSADGADKYDCAQKVRFKMVH